MHRERAAVRIERRLVVAELLHDGAEPRERAEVTRLTHQHLADIRNRAAVVLGVEEDRGAAVPSLDIVRLEVDDGAEELERDIELLLLHRGLDPTHQEIAGVAASGEPERPDAVLDVFGAFIGRRDLERLEELVDVDLGVAGLRLRQIGRRLDHLRFRIGPYLGLGALGRLDLRTRDLRVGAGGVRCGNVGFGHLRKRADSRYGCEEGGGDESVESIGHGRSLTLYQGVGKAGTRSKWCEIGPVRRASHACPARQPWRALNRRWTLLIT